MKRCPECRKDYLDDSLSYCLDDGVALVQGPVTGEAATAILSDPNAATEPLVPSVSNADLPTSQQVASESNDTTGLRPVIAVCILAAIIAALLLNFLIGRQVNTLPAALVENSPESLAHRAQEIIRQLGYTTKPVDTAWGLYTDQDHKQYLLAADNGSQPFDPSNDAASMIVFWYRQSPRYMVPTDNFGWVNESDPPDLGVSGMVNVQLDPSGRLMYFKINPKQVETPTETKPPEPDWSRLIALAGFNASEMTSAPSAWLPPIPFDTRVAWTGTYRGRQDIPVRLEGASYQGQPVYFMVVTPWSRPLMDQDYEPTTGEKVAFGVVALLSITLLTGAVLLARRNLSRNRDDGSGAGRLAILVATLTISAWAIGSHHVPTFHEIGMFFKLALSQSLLIAAMVWVLYLALEPHVRRLWPETIISWSSVLAGRLRDPLVGKHVLIGSFAGVICVLLERFATFWATTPLLNLDPLRGTRQFIAVGFLSNLSVSILLSLFCLFLIFFFRVLVRRRWAAGVLLALFLGGLWPLSNEPSLVGFSVSFATWVIFAFLYVRFGVLSVAITIFVSTLPYTQVFTEWYSGRLIVANLAVVALAAWAFHTSLGGQTLFAEGILGEE